MPFTGLSAGNLDKQAFSSASPTESLPSSAAVPSWASSVLEWKVAEAAFGVKLFPAASSPVLLQVEGDILWGCLPKVATKEGT